MATQAQLEEINEDQSGWIVDRTILFLRRGLANEDLGEFQVVLSPNDRGAPGSWIEVTNEVPLREPDMDQKAFIQVVYGADQNQGLSIGHQRDTYYRDGKKFERHFDMMSGHLSIHVHANHGKDCNRLANKVRDVMLKDRAEYVRQLRLHDVGPRVNVSALSPPGALIQVSGTPVSYMKTVMAPIFFTEAWEIEKKSVPIGEAAAMFGGTAPSKGVELEELKKLNVRVDLRYYQKGIPVISRAEMNRNTDQRVDAFGREIVLNSGDAAPHIVK